MSKIQDETFAKFWLNITSTPPQVLPQQENSRRVSASPPAEDLQVLLSSAHGKVLDVGSGSGVQLVNFKLAKDIKELYCVEPCKGLHNDLKRRVSECGFADIFQLLPCGTEEDNLRPMLEERGILPQSSKNEGIFNTIVCIKVLCCVHDMRNTIDFLHRLLKPGGALIVCEHYRNPVWRSRKGSIIGWLLQVMYSFLGWQFFTGNCHLMRDTPTALKNAHGGRAWESVELETIGDWGVLPHVYGKLIKKRD